jgi:hypothetical protein
VVLARRLLGFGLGPAVSLLSLFAVVPIISRTAGAPGVIAATVGPSVGAVAAIVVSLGWPLLGPAMIARASAADRAVLYHDSVASRLIVLAVAVPVCAVVAAALVDAERPACALLAVAFAATGLTCHWYYFGTGSARQLNLREAIPRMLALALAAVAMLVGLGLVWYPLMLLLGAAANHLLVLRDATGGYAVRFGRRHLGMVRQHLAATLSRLANGLYVSGAGPVVAAVAPASVLVFGSYDRVQKAALNFAGTLPGALDSSVAASFPPDARRQRLVMTFDAALATGVSAMLFAAYPPLMTFLYADLVAQDQLVRLLAAVGLGLLLFNRTVMSHGLLPWKDTRVVTVGLTALSITGFLAVTAAAALAGARGVFAAVVAVEGLTVLLGVLRLHRLRVAGPERRVVS